VCDLYGLFLHMKEVHHGLLCMYCLKLFKKVGPILKFLFSSVVEWGTEAGSGRNRIFLP
jgi:hypothetical protein